MNQRYGYLTLLAVIGASIVFGMVVGGRLNAPDLALAASEPRTLAVGQANRPVAPAMGASGRLDFADVAEAAMPAIVSVTNTQVRRAETTPNPHGGEDPQNMLEEFFEQFRNREAPMPETEPFLQEPQERRENSAGSGFLISPDGYLMTNYHVVADADRLVVAMQDGTQFDAEVIGTDPGIDFALLKIDPRGRTLPFLALGDSDSLRVGEWAMAIGNPLEFSHSVTVGVVSAIDRTVPLRGTDMAVAQFIQTDAAINLGNSGGPLLNVRGEVIGINTAINRERLAEGIGFALPIADAIRSRDQILATGEVKRGILGVTMNPDGIDADAMKYYGLPDRNGVIVAEVTEDGPADDAGIRPEDIIRKLDDHVIRGNSDLIDQVASRRPGDRVRIELLRDGEVVRTEAVLRERQLRGGRVVMAGAEDDAATSESDQPDQPVAATGLGLTVETFTPEAFADIAPHRMPRGGLEPGLEGVLITYVELASPAADKGLVRGLVVTAVNGKTISGEDDWRARMSGIEPGDVVKLAVRSPYRDDVSRFVFLTVPRSD